MCQCHCSVRLQWACDTHALVVATGCPNYKLARVKVPMDLNRAIIGPCVDFPFQVHYSPILSRPKVDDTRRVIVNLSHPWGRAVIDYISNEVYDEVAYTLKYLSVEDIVDTIDHLGGDVLLSK